MLSEISGSESVVHVAVGEDTWVSQSHGVHRLEVGEAATLYIDIAACFYFDGQQELIVEAA